ncbi:iron ABC transporter substrate-binding protein [Halobacteriales archaeon QS_1_68_17]|nr:MAG: iron ABC transporter substrate-binding protein [Halobacteriales archaeon QS_1_68_17]
MDETGDDPAGGRRATRRGLLQTGVVLGTVAVAGCNADSDAQQETETGSVDGGSGSESGSGSDGGAATGEDPPWYGSGPGAFGERPPPGGTSMDEMPDLSGTLAIYSGRGEGLVGELLSYIESRYPDLTLRTTYDSAAALANKIDAEGGNTPADVFYSVNAGALGFLADAGRTDPLAEATTSLVPGQFRADDGSWVGTSGRARTVPYNTNALSESDVPTDIMAFPEQSGFQGEIGWAPAYSSLQGFVTAMRVLEGDQATREWLRGMLDLGVQAYSDEFAVSQAVADGELQLGFANHYYIQRVLAGRPNAPIATAFTQNDAGSVFNVAGAARVSASDTPELADAFVRHLLSAEAQEYFAVTTFEYPLVEGVDPIGRLPPVSELSVPEIDLSELSNLDETVRLMRDVGVL